MVSKRSSRRSSRSAGHALPYGALRRLTDAEFDVLRRVLAAGGSVDFELSQGRRAGHRLRTSTVNRLVTDGLLRREEITVWDHGKRASTRGALYRPRRLGGPALDWRYFATAAGIKAFNAEAGARLLAAEGVRL